MQTTPRLTSLAALVAVTISSSVAAAGPEPVSLVTRDLDGVTAGSAEALRALTDDNSRAGAGTFTGRARPGDGGPGASGLQFQEVGRTGIAQQYQQAAPVAAASLPGVTAGRGANTVDRPQFGVPGMVPLSSLTGGINGSDGLARPLANDATIGVLLSLGAGVVDRPTVIGTAGGGVSVVESGSGGELSEGGQIRMIAMPGRLAQDALDFSRGDPLPAMHSVELPFSLSRITPASR